MADSTEGFAPVRGNGIYSSPENIAPNSAGLIASERGAATGTVRQTERLTSVTGSVDGVADDSKALDAAIRDHLGRAYTESNPLPIFNAGNPGTKVREYNVSTIAKNGSATIDYTVVAANLLELKSLVFSSMQAGKVTLQVEDAVGAGTFSGDVTLFITARETFQVDLAKLEVETGRIIRLVIENKDNDESDFYTTLSGIES